MAVCRGVLDDPNDSDDAFQASFLLLARKARSIWIDGSIGGWLHRVAWRIAFQVKTDAARRRRLEQKAAELAARGRLPVRPGTTPAPCSTRRSTGSPSAIADRSSSATSRT